MPQKAATPPVKWMTALPAKSVKEFVALARSHPGQINYSSSGNGSAPHLSMALFASMAGIRLVHVPYKGGAPQVTALVSGETQASLATLSTVLAHIQSGRLRALGVASLKRSNALPELPTIAEAGVPGYEMSPWVGAFAPAGTAATLVNLINRETARTLNLPDVKERLLNAGVEVVANSPAEFAAMMKADVAKWSKVIRQVGIQE